MKTKAQLSFFIVFIFCSINTFAASIEEGKVIFTTRCTSCHNVNAQLVGPALADVEKRRSAEWLAGFIHSPKAMIEKKDKDAVALYNQFNQIIMPDHPDISAEDVNNILAYIKSETKTGAVSAAPFARPGKIVPNYRPLSLTGNYGFFISYLVSVAILVLALVFAVNVKDMQRKV